MIELDPQREEPPELLSYRRHHPHSAWDANDFDSVRQPLRERLNNDQGGLCVYCEGTLNADDGHIEHIKPRRIYPQQTFEYANLAHSCSSSDHCGHFKKDTLLPIEPRPNCNTFFALMLQDGNLVPALGLTDEETMRSQETIRLLGLNCAALAWQRMKFAQATFYLAQSNPDSVAEFLQGIAFRWTLRSLDLH